MTRAVSLLSLALVAVVTGANRTSSIEAPRFPARHTSAAAGSLGRILEGPFAADPRPIRDETRAAARRRLQAGAPGTYIDEILLKRDSSLARWPDRSEAPLTVWIQPASAVADFGGEYVNRVREAFDDWDRLRLPVRFAYVADSGAAEVHVTWIDRFDQPISGRTRWTRDDDWRITDANIVLALHHTGGELLDHDAMHAMALHEVGHLLGLDHTGDSSSVMAPRVRVRGLSDADRATVRLVYALPAGSVR